MLTRDGKETKIQLNQKSKTITVLSGNLRVMGDLSQYSIAAEGKNRVFLHFPAEVENISAHIVEIHRKKMSLPRIGNINADIIFIQKKEDTALILPGSDSSSYEAPEVFEHNGVTYWKYKKKGFFSTLSSLLSPDNQNSSGEIQNTFPFQQNFDANRNRKDDFNFSATTVGNWNTNRAIPQKFYKALQDNPNSFIGLSFEGVIFGHFSDRADRNNSMDKEWDNWEGGDFSEMNLSDLFFRKADLFKANFSLANIQKTSFSEAQLENTNFSLANLYNVDFSSALLVGATFEGGVIKSTDFTGTNLKNTNFKNSTISGEVDNPISFTRAILIDADFTDATLTSVDFSGAFVSNSNLPEGIDKKEWKIVNENGQNTIRRK